MEITKTGINDLVIIEPRIFEDERGYFYESFNEQKLEEKGIKLPFGQDNQAKSTYGVIRGLHFQNNPHAQSKLIRCLQGAILDVAVDIRPQSSTYGKWFSIELTENNHKQLLVPQGFAHGYSVLSETAVVMYKCDDFYHPELEGGIKYNDEKLNIDWKIPLKDHIISDKDTKHPGFVDFTSNF